MKRKELILETKSDLTISQSNLILSDRDGAARVEKPETGTPEPWRDYCALTGRSVPSPQSGKPEASALQDYFLLTGRSSESRSRANMK